MKNVLVKLTELLLFALPVCVLGVKHGASGPVALLILISLIGIIVFRSKDFRNNHQLSRDEKLLLLLFLVFSLFSLFSWWWSGMEKSGLKHIGEHMRFMLFIPVYLWLRFVQPRTAFLSYGVMIGAVLSIIVALYDVKVSGVYRAHGYHNAIMFGDMAIILGFMAFAMKDLLQTKSLLWKSLPVIALFSGTAASILSGARGAWIVMPALILILFVLRWGQLNIRYKVTALILVLVFSVLVYIIPSTGVEQRIDRGFRQVDSYTTEQVSNTSLGIRLESWKAAYLMAFEHPLLGVGLGNFQQGAQALIDKGEVQNSAARYDHPHNDYFYHLSVNGLIGLFLLILIFLYPLRLFYKNISSVDLEIKALSAAGMCLVVAFMHFSLTETLMIRSAPVSFYGFFVIVLMALIYNRRLLLTKD